MNGNPKPSFFHTTEFNVWLITSFFNVFVSVFLVILPIAGIHALGVAAGTELSRHAPAAKRNIETPKVEPVRIPLEGIPVAFRSPGKGT